MDWFATLSRTRGAPLALADLRFKVRRQGPGLFLLAVLDSSGSTLRGWGLAAAKGVLASLVETAYLERSRLGVLELAGRDVRWRLRPRRAPKRLDALLARIGGGGGTPLRQGLETAVATLRSERRRLPDEQQLLILITDGRSRDHVDDLRPSCRTVVVDMEAGLPRLGRCRALAEQLGGDYVRLADLPLRTVAAENGE